MATHPSGARNQRGRSRGRQLWGALAATALVSTMLVVGSAQSGAATTTKQITATCSGADATTSNALSAFGGSLATPVTVTTEAPAFVEPGQTGVPITVSWALSLDAATVNTVVAISPSLKVSNAEVDSIVSGPTSTTVIPGRPADQTINLVAGQPFSSPFPPFTGELNDIGSGGIIKISTQQIKFAITLTSGPLTTPLNLSCSTGSTLATIPIKVAGSPDIVQPIESKGEAGKAVTLDVLNQFVTNGKTKAGEEQKVDPATLRIVEGDAQIVDGKVVANYPAAGTNADVTFEVCAGTIQVAEADPGTSEIQELRIFEDLDKIGGKRQLGARFNFAGEQAANVLWSATPLISFLPDVPWRPDPDFSNREEEYPAWWAENVNTFALLQSRFRAPSAAEVKAALESIPTIGAGNVKVTQGAPQSAGDPVQPGLRYHPYVIEFQGTLKNSALDQIGTAKLYSFFPQEIKAGLLGAASGAGGDGEGEGEGPEPTPIPEGLTAKQYVDNLNYQAGWLLSIGDIFGYLSTTELMLKVLGENIGSLIDIGAATALLNQLFQPTPEVVTLTQGEDPVAAQTQDLCSQGVITLSSAAVEGATATPAATDAAVEGATATNSGGASLSPAG